MYRLTTVLAATLLLAATASAEPDPRSTFIDQMVNEHAFDRDQLNSIFSQAQRRDDIIELMSRPAEKRLEWGEYRKIFLTQSRIDGGVEPLDVALGEAGPFLGLERAAVPEVGGGGDEDGRGAGRASPAAGGRARADRAGALAVATGLHVAARAAPAARTAGAVTSW